MSTELAVSKTYRHGSLLTAIEVALGKMGKSIGTINIADLAPVDEFHLGGRVATERLMAQLSLTDKHSVLDIGCGLGGAARFAADVYQCQVSGIDLSLEYVETGNILCDWVNLGKRVNLYQGSALDMPFANNSFDRAYMMHVGMNIEDKSRLFTELYRVLRPGAILGIYDVMREQLGELVFPVPWASNSTTSYLATASDYSHELAKAGFKPMQENNRRDFAIEFFKQLRSKTQAKAGPPPLGLHTLMQESSTAKVGNMMSNIENNTIAPVELIVQKKLNACKYGNRY